jgi:hypothetical protein
MSSNGRPQTVPLPPATLKALAFVYHSRRLSERRLASSIGTTHPHVGRIMKGLSRPSQVLAVRLGEALMLPSEFTGMMVAQSSTLGRKMIHPDGFEGVTVAGTHPCPLDEAHGMYLMHEALEAHREFGLAKDLFNDHAVGSIGLVPSMGAPELIHGLSLDPWHEFSPLDSTPIVVWRGPPKAPQSLTAMDAFEFIDAIDPESVVRCTHHDR